MNRFRYFFNTLKFQLVSELFEWELEVHWEKHSLRWSWTSTNGHETPATGFKTFPKFPIRDPGEKMSILEFRPDCPSWITWTFHGYFCSLMNECRERVSFTQHTQTCTNAKILGERTQECHSLAPKSIVQEKRGKKAEKARPCPRHVNNKLRDFALLLRYNFISVFYCPHTSQI